MLPDIDGFEVCRAIRRTSDVPIIMVTARDDTHDVVAGLEAGADDYLTKPFAPKELSARIRAMLRRVRAMDPAAAHLVFGDLEIVPEEGVVRRGGREVHLTKTEFRLLVELASSPGRVLSREVLLERVWGYGYFGDGRLVDVHVRRLRTKVEADPANPRHVVTVRGLGYKLADLTGRRGRHPRHGPPPARPCTPRSASGPRITLAFAASGAAAVRRCWPAPPGRSPGRACSSQREATATRQAYQNARLVQTQIADGSRRRVRSAMPLTSLVDDRRAPGRGADRGRRHRVRWVSRQAVRPGRAARPR